MKKAPTHLGPDGRAWYETVVATFALEAHDLATVELAALQLDVARIARLAVAKEGALIVGRFGEPRPHPAIKLGRDAALTHSRLCRELGLTTAAEESRLPAVAGRSDLRE